MKSKSNIVKNVKSVDVSKYKHHKEGRFTCEAEVINDKGKTICCLHDPKTGEWQWPIKGEKVDG